MATTGLCNKEIHSRVCTGANFSMSANSWILLLVKIMDLRLGKLSSNPSAILTILLLLKSNDFSLGSKGKLSIFRISLLVKLMVSNWSRVAPRFSMMGILYSRTNYQVFFIRSYSFFNASITYHWGLILFLELD